MNNNNNNNNRNNRRPDLTLPGPSRTKRLSFTPPTSGTQASFLSVDRDRPAGTPPGSGTHSSFRSSEKRSSYLSGEKRASFVPSEKRASYISTRSEKRSSFMSTTTQEKRTSAIIYRHDDPSSSASVLQDIDIPDNLFQVPAKTGAGLGPSPNDYLMQSPFSSPFDDNNAINDSESSLQMYQQLLPGQQQQQQQQNQYSQYQQQKQNRLSGVKRASSMVYSDINRPLSAHLTPTQKVSEPNLASHRTSIPSTTRMSVYSTVSTPSYLRVPDRDTVYVTDDEVSSQMADPFADPVDPADQPIPHDGSGIQSKIKRHVSVKKSDMRALHARAKARGQELQRKQWAQVLFEYTFYVILIAFVYLVLVGMPLWKGAVYWLWWVVSRYFVIQGGWAITIGLAAFYSFPPLLILFEKDPPMPDEIRVDAVSGETTRDPELGFSDAIEETALLIPCYKSEQIIGPTLEAALKIFPRKNIFVIANGNSPTPLDNTEEVCRQYNVNHIWSPVGSKIVAQFVGCYAAKDFKYALLIDDDCALPPNFPVVSDRIRGKVKSIGYTIKSVGPESSKGTYCQQAQDLEYKISGLQRALAGIVGSVTFPHGAISLWDREFLVEIFFDHPGFSVSEDWFFGHSCRRLGGRIKMCTAVFVETETPAAVFFNSGGAERGGFGEMTVFKQRFLRWNFFFVNGMYYNMHYIIMSWKLGFWELGAKFFVFQEVYETLLYLLTPFILPISFVVRAQFTGIMLAVTFGMYLLNVLIFNEVHLRLKNERVSWFVLIFYYMPYKFILTFVNVASCYWSLFKYARYFAKRHPKVIEDEKAVAVVCELEEQQENEKRGGLLRSLTQRSRRRSRI